MSATGTDEAGQQQAALVPVALLLGRLLVRELDASTLEELSQPEVAGALAACGITLPEAGELDDLAADYCSVFLYPKESRPPVQSLWTGTRGVQHSGGQYAGEAAVAVRAIAKAAALEPGDGTRGAEPDHIGAILCLWAELIVTRPELAAQLQHHHVAWAPDALAHAVAHGGFYGSVCRSTCDLIQEISRAP